MLITAGERKAMALLCMALHDLGVAADSFTGSQAGIITDTEHTKAKIVEVRADRLREALAQGGCPVVGGAQGVSTDRDVTFLGRGGTDTTAVALAAGPRRRRLRDLHRRVGRVHRRPPGGARSAGGCSGSASRRCWRCARPAARSRPCVRWSSPATTACRLHVRSAFTWEPGTWIEEEDPEVEQAIVSAVISDTLRGQGHRDRRARPARHRGQAVPGLADRSINVDMIEQNISLAGTTDISFTVPHDDLANGRGDQPGPRSPRSPPTRSWPIPTSPPSRSSAPA